MLPQYRTVPELKPVPFAVSVKPGLPAAVEDGDRLVRVRPPVMVNGRGWGDGTPGMATLTLALPAVAIRFDGMLAVN